MDLKGKTIGFALTGSHCTLDEVMPIMQQIAEQGASIIPFISQAVRHTDTRFGEADEWVEKIRRITGRLPIDTIVDAEPVGPRGLLDAMVIAPCTGSTMAKLVCGITDGAVLMAAKAQLRNRKPVVIAISTNDGLGFNAKNLGVLLNTPYVYLVPFGQDNPLQKSNSLVARMELIPDTVAMSLEGRQIQPLLIEY